jgi:hypothetical protein
VEAVSEYILCMISNTAGAGHALAQGQMVAYYECDSTVVHLCRVSVV